MTASKRGPKLAGVLEVAEHQYDFPLADCD